MHVLSHLVCNMETSRGPSKLKGLWYMVEVTDYSTSKVISRDEVTTRPVMGSTGQGAEGHLQQ